jgi:hypothetical protein
MKRSDAFPKKFISKDDVLTPVKAVIAGVTQREIGSGDEMELKVVVEFHGDTKPMILNGTNWDILEAAFGQDSDTWLGKTITLYNDPLVMYGGKKIGGVRIRIERTLTDAEKWLSFIKDTPGVTDSIVRQALAAAKPSEWIAQETGRTVEQAIDKVRAVIADAF